MVSLVTVIARFPAATGDMFMVLVETIKTTAND